MIASRTALEASRLSFELWAEKYRPKSLDQMIDQEEVIKRLKSFVKAKNMPNCIFAGPPGTGKTTAALCLAYDLYGDAYMSYIRELNASVTPDTPILVRKNGVILRTNFGELAKEYFADDLRNFMIVEDLEILSIDRDYNVRFMPVNLISRHKVGYVMNISYEGGSVRTSLSHSVVVIDEEGRLVPKKACELRSGDLLVTFKTKLEGEETLLDFEEFQPQLHIRLKGSLVRNPKVKTILRSMALTREVSWLFGLYLAEGCACLQEGTRGQAISILKYPGEMEIVEQVRDILGEGFGISSKMEVAPSGFNPANKTSVQVRAFNTQFSKFLRKHFYNDGILINATTKRVPSFIYSADSQQRLAFLKGYMGDASGEWGQYVRYRSASKENLIDIAWLGRITGLDTSHFEGETRVIWKLPSYSYIKTEFLPAETVETFLKRLRVPYKIFLKHHVYDDRKRISKELVEDFLKESISKELLERDEKVRDLIKLIRSPLSVVLVEKVEVEEYNGYVYDVSVPGSEMFWGGTTPVLLHNSDERGIDVVRETIKTFARTRAYGDVPFKIMILDESDNLTDDAQQALRRTMEKFVETCRFILIANISGKLIEPLQSRCAIFRFTYLPRKDHDAYLRYIAKNEGVELLDDGLNAIYEIGAGDLRRAINSLQAAASIGKPVTADVVYSVVGRANPIDIKEMLKIAMNGDFVRARERLRDLIFKYGASGGDILHQIHEEVFRLDIPEHWKVELIDAIGDVDFRLTQGADEEIQLSALLARFVVASREIAKGR